MKTMPRCIIKGVEVFIGLTKFLTDFSCFSIITRIKFLHIFFLMIAKEMQLTGISDSCTLRPIKISALLSFTFFYFFQVLFKEKILKELG